MPRILNTRSLTIKGSKVTSGGKQGGGVHKFLGRPVRGGIRGSNAIQEGMIAGLKVARTTLAASLDAGYKRAGSRAFNKGVSAKPITGAGATVQVINTIPGLSTIDVQALIVASMEAGAPEAERVAKAKMKRRHAKGGEPILSSGKRSPMDTLISYSVNDTGAAVELIFDVPGDPNDAAKIFALNFGTGPFSSITGGQR